MLSFRFYLLTALALNLAPGHYAVANSDYPAAVKTIVEQRCMVCHGCYDAPCQLKLDAWAGLQRGASKNKVYDGTRLVTANLTRLFEDARTTQEWRRKGFYAVLGEADPERAVLRRMLELKRQHPLPAGDEVLDGFDFSLNRKQQCPKQEQFDRFALDYPLWGMPYGLPGLNNKEHATLTQWLATGAPGTPRTAPPAAEQAEVERWEAFFNGRSLKQQLMSRYIYEHLFIGNLYFSDLEGKPAYYTLVRSRSGPGEPIDIIATRRPYDSPGKDVFFYRLQPLRTSVMDKRHMPYALNQARMQRWQGLFLDADYTVTSLPGYQTSVASNPFVAFRELPVNTRYRFLLDEAQFTLMGFIKGPVCRGQVALNVIDDHFWVAFTDPEAVDPDQNAEFLAAEGANMRLPSGKSGLLVSLVEWRRYSRDQLKYLQAKSAYMKQRVDNDDVRITLDIIWDGDGSNDNAALTVFRHKDSASVVRGFVGQQPKTAWVIDYSLLERIHYLLVAGFDVYGNVGHQLESRLYMDFLRMEGEQNFLILLPMDQRLALRDFWYRDASSHVKQYVLGDAIEFDRQTDVEYHSDNPKQELLSRLQERLPGATAHAYRTTQADFARVQTLDGRPFSHMPEVAFVDVLDDRGESRVYTILHNSAYSNNAQIFGEAQRRIPVEDYVTIVRGFIGAYPNVFFQLHERDLGKFISAIENLRDEQDYGQLVSRYGVRRNASWFWKLSDKFHMIYRERQPVSAGLFDLNRYENR